jgi:hypothetical protein
MTAAASQGRAMDEDFRRFIDGPHAASNGADLALIRTMV